MNVFFKSGLIAIVFTAMLGLNVLAAEAPSDTHPRMANGAVIEGTVIEAVPDGLVIQGAKGNKYTAPWKYLSAGTRYRYELPMLAAQEVARSNALKKAAAATAASNTAAAKAASAKTAAQKAATNKPPAK